MRAQLRARVWAVVFLAVGVGIALVPVRVAGLVEATAAAVGLHGPVEAPRLLHVLAVSLLACITAGGWTGDMWKGLMAGKVTSTVGFGLLAVTVAPAWWLCALADASVALTLAWEPDARPLMARWLADMGSAAGTEAALTRAARYPAPLDRLYPWIVDALDRWAPLFLLGRARRAHGLPAADLQTLEERLLSHRIPAVRGAYVLFRAPLSEVRWPGTPPAPRVHPLDAAPPPTGDRFDVVVIGSGAGGAPLAWRLARKGWKVAIVEAGDLVRPSTSEAAVERWYLQQGTLVTLDGAPVLAASAVGGTTPVNSGTCLRPLPARLAEWDAALGTRFAKGLLDPWLDEVEAAIGVGVPDRALLPRGTALFEAGLRGIGREGAFVLPRNAPGCEGRGMCCFGCPTGAKRSTDLAFLPGAVEAGAVLFRGERARAVHDRGDEAHVELAGRTLRARHVVIAAGAIGTPALVRGAGGHLRLHPATKVLAAFPDAIHADHGVPQGLGYRPPELPRLTLEAIHVPAGALAPVITLTGERQRWWMDRADHLASFGMMVHDRGTGRVDHVAGRPVLRYHLHDDDGADLRAGILMCARAWFAAGAERVLLPLLGARNEFGSASELDDAHFGPAHIQWAAFHPQGTAGIGRVVDPDLRLSPRVHVCDASVLPGSPGANPQLTIMALSLRLADRLAQ